MGDPVKKISWQSGSREVFQEEVERKFFTIHRNQEEVILNANRKLVTPDQFIKSLSTTWDFN